MPLVDNHKQIIAQRAARAHPRNDLLDRGVLGQSRDRGIREKRVQLGRLANQARECREFLLHLLGLLFLERDVNQRSRIPFRQRLQFAPFSKLAQK